jgi:ribosomal protein S18 acetylase RimI-like enzyme
MSMKDESVQASVRRVALSIRSAEADDEAAVVALWRACGLVASYNDPVEDFAFARAGACSDVLVGVHEGRIAASVMVGHDGHRGWLYYVSADPGLRGAGAGGQIVRAGEAWLRARGVPKVQLLVRETNTDVVSFYEHLGFETAPRTVMSKWLPAATPEG